MVREIAQHVGGESKYPNVVLGFLRIGDEEGLPGLFSGIVPMLAANFIRTLGIAGLGYAASRLLIKAEVRIVKLLTHKRFSRRTLPMRMARKRFEISESTCLT